MASSGSSTFPSKIDTWFAVVLIIGMLAVLLGVGASWPHTTMLADITGQVATLLLGVGLPLWILAATDYRLVGNELLIRSGPMRWRIPLQDIRRVEPSRSWLSSPALSLQRLRIHYGKSGKVLVSPKDPEGFIQALRRINPQIEASGYCAP